MENGTNVKIEKINSALAILQIAVSDLIDVTPDIKKIPEFEEDRLTKTEAAKFVGVSMPTFDKLVKSGKFKQYNIGQQKLFLRSEIVEALKSNC
ncbi:MAG TPA: helix-turn-helix domain-containing protein [Prolixibacteraceae bacterium]|nr:helix-turn-helix domain-containing protein [Prolixibacteraceae bacterium]